MGSTAGMDFAWQWRGEALRPMRQRRTLLPYPQVTSRCSSLLSNFRMPNSPISNRFHMANALQSEIWRYKSRSKCGA